VIEDNAFDEAERLIQKTIENGSQFLDFSHLNLEHIPESIGQLTELKELNLEGLNLRILTGSIGQLTQLEYLLLGGNKLDTLPDSIGKLTQLKELYLEYNLLTILPGSMGQLTQLELLQLGDNKLNTLPESIGQLTQLKELYLELNGINKLPESIGQLTQLKTLSIFDNNICVLPGSLKELTQLEYLLLGGNEFEILPEPIGQLTQLKELDLSFNQLNKIPDFIGELTKLERLNLSSNNFGTSLPKSIGQLTQLKELDLSYTQYNTLPEFIGELTKLEKLNLAGNKLSILPESLTQLTRLKYLDLSSNQLDILSETIGKLKQIHTLYLSNNQINTLPESIVELTQLRVFDLSINKLSTISEHIVKLTKLEELNLEYNELNILPVFIAELPLLKEISLDGNPLEIPPYSIAKRGINAINDYFKQIIQQGVDYLYEAKLLIVGDPGAGKTTLLNKLIDPDYNVPNVPDATIGVNIHSGWIFPFKLNDSDTVDFRVNIWDFGGQKHQYMTHQFFLTTRSLYVLVTDDREQKTNFDYWFNIIGVLGNKSPVIVLLNEKNHSSITNFDSKKYHSSFTHFKDVISVDFSNPNDGRCESVRHKIQYYLTHLKHIGEALPKQWIPIRNVLEMKRSEGYNYIDFTEYQDICIQQGIVDDTQQLNLSQHFHALGVILHYQHDDDLFVRVILNPNWVADAVYSVLKDKIVHKNNGRFSKKWLFNSWGNTYTGEEKRFLLLLMLKRKFDICYPVEKIDKGVNAQYIAPQLLPNIEPAYTWNDRQNLILRYSYTFLPYGLITRLIVRLNEWIYIENKEIFNWKSGCILVKDHARSLVRQLTSDKGQNVIEIRSDGRRLHRQSLLQFVSNTLLDLHKESYNDVEYDTEIPCNYCLSLNKENPKYWPLRELNTYIENNHNNVPCGVCGQMISPMGLIFGVFTKEHLERQPQIYNIQQYKDNRTMGDTNINKGQAGAVGRNAHVHDINFNQVWEQNKADIDLEKLSQELAMLREALIQDAKQPEQFTELAHISTAENEANEGNGVNVLEALSKVGTWGLGVAEKIGVGLAVTCLKITIGL